MTRLLLASVAFAILQLGVPHGPGAADLLPGGECERVAPQFEALSKAALGRADSTADDTRLNHTTCAPAARTQTAHRSAVCKLTAREPERAGAGPLPSRLPHSRAPPA